MKTEAELIELAYAGDMEARRQLTKDTMARLYRLEAPSLSVGLWIADVLMALSAADNAKSLDEVLSLVGENRRARGRRKNVVAELNDVHIVAAVNVLEPICGKTKAVQAVAAAEGQKSATPIWHACAALEGKIGSSMVLAKPVLEKLRVVAAADRLNYTEMLDFLGLTPPR
jgi:hypothetical protein